MNTARKTIEIEFWIDPDTAEHKAQIGSGNIITGPIFDPTDTRMRRCALDVFIEIIKNSIREEVWPEDCRQVIRRQVHNREVVDFGLYKDGLN